MQQTMELTEVPRNVSKNDCPVFSIDNLEHKLKKCLCFHVLRSRVVWLPRVLAWKFRGIFLACVAGVHREASLLEISAPQKGRLVLSMCHEDGSMCILSLGYETHRSQNVPSQLAQWVNSKF